MTGQIASPEPAQAPTLHSLFNAKSMALKFGRDALIGTVAYGIPVGIRVVENLPAYTASDILPMLGIFGVIGATALSSTLGRYAGGGVSMACNAAFNVARGQPALKTDYGRKPLAALGGIATALPIYMSFMMLTGMIDLNIANAPANSQTIAQAETPTTIKPPVLVRR